MPEVAEVFPCSQWAGQWQGAGRRACREFTWALEPAVVFGRPPPASRPHGIRIGKPVQVYVVRIAPRCHFLRRLGGRSEEGGQYMPRYLGLDLHRRYIHGCEWTPETRQERHFRFPNTRNGWSQFVATLDSSCWVAMEVTGNAFQAYDLLSPHAEKVLLANPIELKRLGSGRHTDRVDAARLAKMLALGTLPTIWVPPLEVREVRILLRYRERLKSTRARFLNQIRAALRRNGCE